MAMKQAEETPRRPHTLELHEDRKGLLAFGVLSVETLDGETIRAMIPERKLVVKGKNLKVVSFSKENGELRLEGEVEAILYPAELSQRAGFWEKLFR